MEASSILARCGLRNAHDAITSEPWMYSQGSSVTATVARAWGPRSAGCKCGILRGQGVEDAEAVDVDDDGSDPDSSGNQATGKWEFVRAEGRLSMH